MKANDLLNERATEVPSEPSSIYTRPFFGTENHTHLVLKTEQPHHRHICYLLAQGYTPTEVAHKTGFTNTTIQYVWKQPWAQELIAQLQADEGRKAVEAALKGGALDAAKCIVKSIKSGLALGEVGKEQDTIPGHKLADATKDAHKLLDRLFGTAVQTIKHVDEDAVKSMSNEELAQIAMGKN